MQYWVYTVQPCTWQQYQSKQKDGNRDKRVVRCSAWLFRDIGIAITLAQCQGNCLLLREEASSPGLGSESTQTCSIGWIWSLFFFLPFCFLDSVFCIKLIKSRRKKTNKKWKCNTRAGGRRYWHGLCHEGYNLWQTETKQIIPSQKRKVRSLTSTPACCTSIKFIIIFLT